MPLYVAQQTPTFCFLACLESFLAENGQIVSQRDILKLSPDAFGNNVNDLGAFSDANFNKIEPAYGLEVTLITGAFASNPPRESFSVVCKWEGRDDSIHWVRLIGMDEDYVYLMNPASSDFPNKVERSKFFGWWHRIYKVKLK